MTDGKCFEQGGRTGRLLKNVLSGEGVRKRLMKSRGSEEVVQLKKLMNWVLIRKVVQKDL